MGLSTSEFDELVKIPEDVDSEVGESDVEMAFELPSETEKKNISHAWMNQWNNCDMCATISCKRREYCCHQAPSDFSLPFTASCLPWTTAFCSCPDSEISRPDSLNMQWHLTSNCWQHTWREDELPWQTIGNTYMSWHPFPSRSVGHDCCEWVPARHCRYNCVRSQPFFGWQLCHLTPWGSWLDHIQVGHVVPVENPRNYCSLAESKIKSWGEILMLDKNHFWDLFQKEQSQWKGDRIDRHWEKDLWKWAQCWIRAMG